MAWPGRRLDGHPHPREMLPWPPEPWEWLPAIRRAAPLVDSELRERPLRLSWTVPA